METLQPAPQKSGQTTEDVAALNKTCDVAATASRGKKMPSGLEGKSALAPELPSAGRLPPST